VASQGRTLTSVRVASAHAPGWPHGKKKPGKTPQTNPKRTHASTTQYKSVQVNTTNKNFFSVRFSIEGSKIAGADVK